LSTKRRVRGISRQARLGLAARYVWWQTPTQTLRTPRLLLRQILRLGTEDDYVLARKHWGTPAIKRALVSAPPGALDERSWAFWHRHFHLKPQPLPRRRFV
jgi:hypothetical protein